MSIDTYGFTYDQLFLPILKRVQYFYGTFMILIVHPIFFYLLLRHSKGFHPGIRSGYIVNQINMLIHDLYNNLVHQMYAPVPYPAVFCSGILCHALRERGFELMILQCLIIAHAISPYFYMIMNTTQQILPHSSAFSMSNRTVWTILFIIYADLCLNAVYFYFGHSIQQPELFDQLAELSWYKSYEGAITIIGRVGELEKLGNYLYFFIFSGCLIGSFMIWIILHALYTVVTYKNFSKSRAHLLQVRFMKMLLIQTSLVSVFYGLPLATLVGMVRFYDFPGWILAIGRCLSLFMYSINSIVECVILLIMTPKYQTIIKARITTFLGVEMPVTNSNRIDHSSIRF